MKTRTKRGQSPVRLFVTSAGMAAETADSDTNLLTSGLAGHLQGCLKRKCPRSSYGGPEPTMRGLLATRRLCAMVLMAISAYTPLSLARPPVPKTFIGPNRGSPLALLIQRRFFQSFLPGSLTWNREAFVCKVLDDYLPKPKPKSSLTALELEPEDGRYWAYLRPPGCKWYLDRVIALGTEMENMPDGILDSMAQQANGIFSKAVFLSWKPPSPFGVPKGSLDFVLMADGAPARLGSRLARAMAEVEKALKPGGRLFIAADETDERLLGMRLDVGWEPKTNSAMANLKLKLVASQRDDNAELVFAQFRKPLRPGAAAGRSARATRRR